MFYRPTLERLENRNVPAAINMWTSILHTNDETGSVESVEIINRDTNCAVSNPSPEIPGQYLIMEAVNGYQIFHANNGELTVQFVYNGVITPPQLIINNLAHDGLGSVNWVDDKIIIQAELSNGKVATAWTSNELPKILMSVISEAPVRLFQPTPDTYNIIVALSVDDVFNTNELIDIVPNELGTEIVIAIQNTDATFTVKTLQLLDDPFQWKVSKVENVQDLMGEPTIFVLYKDTI